MNSDGFFVDLGIWLFYQLLVEPQNPSPLESFSFQKPWKIDKIDIRNLKSHPKLKSGTSSWEKPFYHLLMFHCSCSKGFPAKSK